MSEEQEQKQAALYLRKTYDSEIFKLVIANVKVSRQEIMDYKLICASLDPCLILNLTGKHILIKL